MIDFDYGERLKIGLIYPAPGWIMEAEFQKLAPKGIITLTSRISLLKTNEDHLIKMSKESKNAAKLLVQAPIDVLVFGCTSGSFIAGTKYDLDLSKDLEKIANVKCITTSGSIIKALKKLNIKKISVLSPYIESVSEKAKIFFNENEIEVVKMRSLNLLYDSEIDNLKLKDVYREAKNSDADDSECLVILCTGLRTIGILESLESDLNKPVISAIQASFWNALRTSNIDDKIYGYAKLLTV
ncbi:MAG: Asp/Glu racemase [Tissierellia bacterium]|nr:Asp/Glu racemase [Tissierellia bacterium]